MTGQQSPPEIGNIPLLETKSLKNKSVPWENIELPIDILLLTVNEWEFLSCPSFLNSEFSKSYHDDLGFLYFGDIGEDEATKLKISVMKCYAGAMVPAGATVAVQNAVRALRPKAVISVGSCASLNREKAKLGDVVVSAKLTTYAPTKHTDNGIEELGHSVPPKKHLADLIKSVDDGWEAPLKKPGELVPTVVRDGVFLSGPEEVKSQQRCAQLTKRFPNAVAIEMEGEGLYAAAHALDIEWIIIKGISEYADGSGASQDSWRRFASVMAASLTVNMLSELIVFQRWPHYGDSQATSSSTVAKRKGKSLLTGGSAPKRSKSAPRSKARNAKQSKATPSTSTNDSVVTSSSTAEKRKGHSQSTEEPVPKRGKSSASSEVGQSVTTSPWTADDSIKDGVPDEDVLEELSVKLGNSWERVARRLKFEDEEVTAFHKENEEYAKKALKMLFRWKRRDGSEATYRVLHAALSHKLVGRKDLAETFCRNRV